MMDGAGMMMVRICWKIGETSGCGFPIEYTVAVMLVDDLNDKHGAGTHWIEEIGETS